MSAEQGGSCPFAGQPRTETQRLQVAGSVLIYGAIDLGESVHGPADALPPRIELLSFHRNILNDRDTETSDESSSFLQDLQRTMNHEVALRRMLAAPFGFYVQKTAYGAINEYLDELSSRDPRILLTNADSTDEPPYTPQHFPSYYYGADAVSLDYESMHSGNTLSMHREYHGQFAHLLRIAEADVWAAATQAYMLMPEGKRAQLEQKYAAQTKNMKVATRAYIEKKFPGRVDELTSPSYANSPLEGLDEFSVLAKRLAVTDNLPDSFTAACLSTVESVARRLFDLRTLCGEANIPAEQWPLAYANIRKLALGSQTSVKASDIYDFEDPRYEDPYVISWGDDGVPHLDFSETKTGKYYRAIYETHRYQGCQGAVEELPMKSNIRAGMRGVHERLAERAGEYGMDVDFAGAFSAAQVLTALIVLSGEWSRSRLNRSSNQQTVRPE